MRMMRIFHHHFIIMIASGTEISAVRSDATIVSSWGTLHGGSWRESTTTCLAFQKTMIRHDHRNLTS